MLLDAGLFEGMYSFLNSGIFTGVLGEETQGGRAQRPTEGAAHAAAAF